MTPSEKGNGLWTKDFCVTRLAEGILTQSSSPGWWLQSSESAIKQLWTHSSSMFTYQEYCLETLSGGPNPLSRDKTKVKCSSEWYRCVFPDMPWVYLLPTICSSCCYRFLKTLPVLQTQHKCTWVISFVTASLPLSPPSAVYNSGANYSKCFIHIWTYLIFTTTWQGNYEYWHFIGEAHVIHLLIYPFLYLFNTHLSAFLCHILRLWNKSF